jgi:hypothetical protein
VCHSNCIVQHRLAQAKIEEFETETSAPVAEEVKCPFWSCIPILDAIVAFRASVIAFNAPCVRSVAEDDQCSDVYTLCATRCCQAAVAFVASKSPASPSELAPQIRAASLLSPDSSGADSFEGCLALHSACDVLTLASYLSYQPCSDAAALEATSEGLCPVDLVNNMADAAASLSDSHMYGFKFPLMNI